MKLAFPRPQLLAAAFTLAASIFSVSTLTAQTAPTNTPKPVIATTLGYGGDQLLNFTYTQNFDCIDQPNSDLNFNGIVAANDPGEMQIPICQVGTQPSINPNGKPGNPQVTTPAIFVLVPMFSTNNDQNPNDAISCDNVVPNTTCGAALGNTLISLFGNPVLKNQRLIATEAGLRKKLSEKISFDSTVFYNRYQDLVSEEAGATRLETDPPPEHLLMPTYLSDLLYGETHGGEIFANVKLAARWTMSPGYTFLAMHLHTEAASLDTTTIPETEGGIPNQQAQLRSNVNLP